jgi:tetratricopeptide (TPR) repeat protein
MDKAISLYPERLDLRVLKANVYMTYEKGSPEMTSAYLKSLATEGAARKEDWNFDGEMKDKEFFKDAMEQYCYSIFQIATPQARKAFYELSQHMYKLFPDRINFLNNVGSYYLVTEDFKAALKVYSKVLKKNPDNLVAIQNCVIASRMLKDPKLEVKYLQMMVKYAPQREALLAKSRMEALTKK